jgi:Sensors of blue-light using FAD
MLIRLLYASRAAGPVTAQVVDSILAQSRAHNPALGITGILCHGGDIFMQVLEGGRGPVNELYNSIVRDSRHRDVVVLHYEEVAERRFAGWTMGMVNIDKLNPAVLLKYGDRPVLDPYAVSGRASMALLEELIATASIVGRAG